MKQRAVLVILFAAVPAGGAAIDHPQDQRNIESEIRAAETSRFKALTDGDLPALERALSDDLVYTHASGWRQTKAELLPLTALR
jgi:hypothetical protein